MRAIIQPKSLSARNSSKLYLDKKCEKDSQSCINFNKEKAVDMELLDVYCNYKKEECVRCIKKEMDVFTCHACEVKKIKNYFIVKKD